MKNNVKTNTNHSFYTYFYSNFDNMVTELLKKYIWLVQKFITAGERGLSLPEIQRDWKRKFGTEYPRRTFNNHREAVYEVFGIEIECDRSSSRYLIRHGDDISDKDANTGWLIDTFTVNSIVPLARERLSGRVSVENIPSGRKYLAPLMNAMQENNIVEISYRKYGAAAPDLRHVRPYGIKEVSLRWYLVGWAEERASCRVYALDRIERMKILPERFDMPAGFDIDTMFATSFGSYLSSEPGQKIVFRAYGKEASYIRDLPLHHTQTVEKEDGNSTTFSIFVSPNTSLFLEFLRHGAGIEVLSPPHIREKMKDVTGEMNGLYNKSIL